MTRIDEELKLAKDDGRSSEKIIKMLRNSERRPPAYFVYNTTQSSEGGSPRRVDVDVTRKSKADLLDLN